MRASHLKLVVWLLFFVFLSLLALSATPNIANSAVDAQGIGQIEDLDLTGYPYSIFLPAVIIPAEPGTEPLLPGPPLPEGPSDPPGEPGEQATGFEIDGNTSWDEIGSMDWETANFPPAMHIQDPHSKGARDTTVFKGNGKFDHPEDWQISQGKVGPPQTELTNLMTWFVKKGDLGSNTPSNAWLILAMERSKSEGTFFLDFEYNQIAWDGSSGGLRRSPGDLSIGFAIHGNPDSEEDDLRLFIIQYYPGEPPVSCAVQGGPGGKPELIEPGNEPCPSYGDYGWYYRFLGSSAQLAASGLGEATMNEGAFPAAWPSFDNQGDARGEIPPFQFAEAAINLDALNIEVNCATWSSIHAKGRSSLQATSDLKDLAGPIQLAQNCRLEGHKFLDVNGNGNWDEDEPPLANWQIRLSDSDMVTTDEQGFYEFSGLKDGAYQVSENCPLGWVQTSPGLTDFAGCGSQKYEVDINIDNSQVTGLDFGNGRPELSASQTCQGDVFLGDDIRYTVRITNEGIVDLLDVVIDEPEAGEVQAVDRLHPGQSATLTYSVTATAPGTVLKAVKIKGTYGLATVRATAEASCQTQVHSLAVTKQAQTTLDRRYNWTINKEVDNPGPIALLRGESLQPVYTVTVGLADPPYVDSNLRVSGTIMVDNPAPITASLASVLDRMEPGGYIPVICPTMVIPPGESLLCTYGPLDLPDVGNLLNTATVTLNNNNGQTTDFKDTIEVDFDSGVVNTVDDVVDVNDTLVGSLGSVNFSEAPKTISYNYRFVPSIDTCGEVQIHNVARFVAKDSGATGRAAVSANLFVICNMRLGFEDLSVGGGNDWDYNDLVVDVGIRVTLSDDPYEPDLEAVHLTMSRLVGGPEYSIKVHEFHVAPDLFTCDGRYLLRTYPENGPYFDKVGDYHNGDDFLILTEAGPLPKRVELSIFFDVPPEGCPFDNGISDDPLNTYHGEALFFRPWMKATRNGSVVIVKPGDPRLLAVPDTWQWPDEMQSIWLKYPKVIPGNPPIFSPFWWQD